MSKFDAYGKVLNLLNKITQRVDSVQDRLSEVEWASGKTADTVLMLQDASAIANKNQTEALYNFRESVGSAFVKIKEERDNILMAVQRLNERVSQVESQNLILVENNKILRADVEAFRADAKNLTELKTALRLFLK